MNGYLIVMIIMVAAIVAVLLAVTAPGGEPNAIEIIPSDDPD
jgi:hypothetical protein